MPVQGPYATFLSDNDDFDLGLYTDGPMWLVKLELDYDSSITGNLETVEKEFGVDARYIEKYSRGYIVNRMEMLFDETCAKQLPFINIVKLVEIRNAIANLMEEAFERMDREKAEATLKDVIAR